MNKDDLEYRLIRGLDVPYMQVLIKQPTIDDIDKYGYVEYSLFTYPFKMQKEHLQLYDEIKNELIDKSLFESIIINDKCLMRKNDFNINNSMLLLLKHSLAFFLNIQNFDMIQFDEDNEKMVIYNSKEFNGKVYTFPVFSLDKDNFDEFSELIRIINCAEIIESENNKEKQYYAIYDDPELQQAYDELMQDSKKKEEESKSENSISFNDMIHDICNSKYSKETIDTISKRTIWQIFDIYKSMNIQESVNFNKQQYCSYKFEFKEAPIIDWKKINKIHIESNLFRNN